MKKKNVYLMGVAIHFILAVRMADPAAAHAHVTEETHILEESTVVSQFLNSTKSPIRIKTVDNDFIKMKAASKSYPEMLGNLPGVYATSESGSFGDAKVNIRGFKQENISILLNGIPISGQTSGNMYWSNWMGLADATYAIQVQKGAGSSMLSDNSVGGTINIMTLPATDRFNVDLGIYGTHYGAFKGYFNINSGELTKGWRVNLMLSYLGGKGYVDQTEVSTLSYMFNLAKSFGEHHSLVFTALGSPEKHGQRSSKLTSEEVGKYGLRYNKNWGWLDGKPYNLSRNNYYKPYFTLQHRFDDGKWFMQNSLYLAIANGGGRWNESKGKRMQNILGEDGLIDFGSMLDRNREISASGLSGAEGGAEYILSDFMAGHTQVGAIISGGLKPGKGWKIEFGTHYQHYSTWEKEEITDLLGGNYWWERGQEKKVGDFIRTDNGKVTDHFTLYTQASYDAEKLHATLGVSGIGSVNRRWDRFNYTEEEGIWSKKAVGAGFSAKAGLLYQPHSKHSIYINGGAYSRVPYAGVWFASGNNEITSSVKNEKNYMSELGYRFVYDKGGVEVTGYYDWWDNRSMMSNKYKPADGEEKKYMISGLDARHFGLEVTASHRFFHWMELSAYVAAGSWKWMNDVSADIYDDYTGMVIDEVKVYTKGLHVGDAPQLQVGASLDIDIPLGFNVRLDWAFNDRMYADFDPSGRQDPEDRAQPFKLPSYHLLDLHLGWTGNLGKKCRMTVFADGKNLLNSFYIERGKDGKTHNLDSFTGFWGFGTNASFGIRFTPTR